MVGEGKKVSKNILKQGCSYIFKVVGYLRLKEFIIGLNYNLNSKSGKNMFQYYVRSRANNTIGILLLLISFSSIADTISADIISYPPNFTPGTTSGNNTFVFEVSKTTSGTISGITVSALFSHNSSVSEFDWSCTGSGGGTGSTCSNSGGNSNSGQLTTIELVGTNVVTVALSNIEYNPTFLNTSITFNANTAKLGHTNDNDFTVIDRLSSTDINFSVSSQSTNYTPGLGDVYTFTVSNVGPSEAKDVQFSDTVPSGMSITGWSCSVTPGSNCGGLGGNNGNVNPQIDLDVNGTATITVTASYDSSLTTPMLDYIGLLTLEDPQATDPDDGLTVIDTNQWKPDSNLVVSVNTEINSETNYTPGASETYEISITNNGPSDVAGVVFTDNNLSEYESISWTCDDSNSGATCASGSGPTVGPLSATANLKEGATITYTVSVNYLSGTLTDPLVYTAYADNPATHTPNSQFSGSKSLNRKPFSEYSFILSNSQNSYTPGTSNITYTAVLTNLGPTDVLNANVDDNDLSEFESISWSCTSSSANSTCDETGSSSALTSVVDIVKDDSITFEITVDYFSDAVANPLVYTLTADNPNNTANSTSVASDSDTLDRQVNLSILKTGKVGTLVPNEPFTYSIVITNDGPSDLGAALNELGQPIEEGVRLVDDLDDTLINDPNPANCQAGTETPCWKYCESDQGVKDSDISPTNCPGGIDISTGSGSLIDVPIRLSAGSSSEIIVYARVSNSSGSDCINSGDANALYLCNTASISLVETATTTNIGTGSLTSSYDNEIIIGTDILVTKTDGIDAPDTISPGTVNSYQVTVSNEGFINVENIAVTDVMPLYPSQTAGFIPGTISWTCETADTGACCNTQSTACGLNNPTPSIVSDTLNTHIDLDSQSAVVFTISGTVSNDATGTLTNQASATLPTGITDSNESNNTLVTDMTSLAADSDIRLIKTLVSSTPVNTGSPLFNEYVNLTYQVDVTNLGPSFATNVSVEDQLDSPKLNPASSTWNCSISGTGSCAETGTVSGTPLVTTVDLAVDSSAIFSVTVSTEVGAEGKVINTASATASGSDPVGNNNQDSVEYSLTGSAELTIDNDDARSDAVPGESINYTVRVANEGPDNVFGATVQNIFPPQLQNVNWTCSAVSPIPGDLSLFQFSDQSAAGSQLITSPDGNHVYVASPDTDDAGVLTAKINVYSRSTLVGGDFGQLQFVQNVEQGVNQVDGIEQPKSLVMDNAGRFLYVLSDINSGSTANMGISIFGRDTNSLSASFGHLTYLGLMVDMVPTTVEDMVISSDQKHLYISGGGKINRYQRDTGSGLLTFEDEHNLADAGQMVMSSGGNELYVVDATGNDIHGFTRDSDQLSGTFGDLTSLNSVNNSSLVNVTDVVLSADDKDLYLASTGNDSLVLIKRDISTGELSFGFAYNNANLSLVLESIIGLSSVAVSNDGEHVIVGMPTNESVLVLTRNSQGFLNKQEEQYSAVLNGVSDVAFSPDGRHVFMTATEGGGKNLTAYARRQPDPLFSFMEAELNGVNDLGDSGDSVQGMLGASAVAASSDGLNVYVTGLGSDSVVQFSRDKTKGGTTDTRNENLSYQNTYTDGEGVLTGLNDVDSITVSPNGSFVYVGSSDSATLTVFRRAANGNLSYETTYNHVNNQIDGLLGVSSILINASSQHLYLAGRFEASVVQYSIDPTNGRLTLVDSVANGDVGISGLAGARSLAFSPEEDQIYVASSIDDSLVVLNRNLSNGNINFIQRNSFAGDRPMDLVVSPDGDHVYVVSANDHKISVFQRQSNTGNPQYGSVTLMKTYEDGVNGFDYIQGARAIDISSQGDKLYVGAEFDHAISVIDRDQNSNSSSYGLLSVIEVQIDEVNDVNGLEQLYDLVVTSDTRHVYSVGFADHALAGFILGSGSSCSAQGTGNIIDSVDVGSNGTLTYSVNATIRSNATGQLITNASIIPPENFQFNNNVDNCGTANTRDACDQDQTTLIPEYDLAISKTDNRISSVPGQAITYEILVSNNGPSDAISAGPSSPNSTESIQVIDILNSGFDPASVNWTCEASGSGSLKFVQSVEQDKLGVTGLTGVSDVEYVSDLVGLGPHVLATSVLDDSVTAYSVNQVTGELTQSVVFSSTVNAMLNGARQLVIVDSDIYVVSQVDDALVALKASDQGGQVLAINAVASYDFASGVVGLNQAVDVIVSADGTSLYVAGANDNSVVIFDRNIVSGVLSNGRTITEGQAGVNGLAGVNALAIAPDGKTVYTSGANLQNIGVYQRDLLSGDLSLIGLLDSSIINEAMGGIVAMTVSADNKHVYVSVVNSDKILVFSRDVVSDPNGNDYGLLTLVQSVKQNQDGVVGILSPNGMDISADGRHLYITGEQSDSVVWFGRDLETGTLSFAGLISDSVGLTNGLNGALDVAVSANGEFVYVAGSLDNAIAVLARTADSSCPASGIGNMATAGLNAGVEVNIAANGLLRFTLQATVASDASNTLFNEAGVYSCPAGHTGPINSCEGAELDLDNNVDSDTNEIDANADLSITKTDGVAQYDGLLGAVNVAGNNEHIYIAAQQENAIGVFSREIDANQSDYGNLAYVDSMSNGFDGVSGLLAVSDVILSLDGLTLYAAGAGDNSVVAFRRDELSGKLSFLEKQSSGLFGVEGLEGVNALSLSADGSHLYAAAPLTGSLTVFRIDQSNGVNQGRLTYIQKLQNAVAGVGGLSAISDVIVAPDDKHVYVISNTENSISLFLRNPNSNSPSFGQLSYMTSYLNGNDGIGGLVGPNEMIADSTGAHVYVLSGSAQSLVVFERDLMTGELTFIEFKQNGTSDVVGLSGATDLTMSSDGINLYVAGQLEDAAVKFKRDPVLGTLIFDQIIKQGDPLGQVGEFVNGLDGVSGVFLSPDGKHQYMAARNSHAVTTFSIDQSVTPGLQGDLSYQQTLIDGLGGVAPGSEITYLIVASNFGPSDAQRVLVQDIFPAEFEQISYECFGRDGAVCDSNLQQGNVNEVVNLPAGSRVEIVATGVIKTDATGVLSNTATVSTSQNPDFAINDPNLANNTATDDNTLLSPAVDLIITKDNGLVEVIPGTPVAYNITVTNGATAHTAAQPSDALGVLITDVVPESISNVNWTCLATPEIGLLDDGDSNTNTNNFTVYSHLNDYADLVVSDNGLFAYTLGQGATGSNLIAYARDNRTGEFTVIQTMIDGDPGLIGMNGLSALSLSHDQKNLYAVSSGDDALITFSRNVSTGLLTFEAALLDGSGGVNGIGGAVDVLVSPDDQHIYVAGYLDNAIAVFNRNIANGSLSFASLTIGVEGLAGVNSMAFDETGLFLIAVANLNQSLASFDRNNSTGALTPIDVIQDFQITGSVLDQPVDVLIQAGKIYVSSLSSDAISLFDMDVMTGEINYQNKVTLAAGSGPSSILLSSNAKQMYVANSGSHSISLYQLIQGVYQLSAVVYDTNLIQELDGLSRLVFSPDKQFVYALSDDDVVLLQVAKGSQCTESGQGQLSDVADIISGGSVTYVLTGDVLPTATGQLINSAQVVVGNDTIELNAGDNIATDSDLLVPTTDLSVTKTDNLLEVVAGTTLDYEINVFSSGPSSVLATMDDVLPIFPSETAGLLSGSVSWSCVSTQPIVLNATYDSSQFSSLENASTIVMNETADRVWVASVDNNEVSVFSKDLNGTLVLLNTIAEGDVFSLVENGTSVNYTLVDFVGLSALALSQDENFLYVTAEHSNSLFVFNIEDSAAIQYVQTLTSGTDGVVGMVEPVNLTVAPDDGAVYVAANGSDSITVFSRNDATGMLTFVERVRDGFGTIVPDSNVIIGINDLMVSPNGKHLYTVSDFSDAIAIFNRNTLTQKLSYQEVVREGDVHLAGNVPGMDGLLDLAFSPNGQYAYFLAADDQSMLYFSRNDSTGQLAYLNQLKQGDVGVGPMSVPGQMALTKDGGKLVITDVASSSVSLYERNNTDGSLTLEDVFSNDAAGGGLMNSPSSVTMDNTNVLVLSPLSHSLTTLRLVADAECPVSDGIDDHVNVLYEMNPSSSAATLIAATVHPSARGTLTNTVNMSVPLGSVDLDALNSTATDTTVITIDTDVSVVKTGPTDVIAGEFIQYQIVLANTGPSDALDVQLIDDMDNVLLNAEWTCIATGRSVCSHSDGSGDINETINVTIDGTVTFVIDALVDPSYFGTLVNTAEAVVFEEGFPTDRDPLNNVSTVTTNVTQLVDLVINKTLTTANVTAGLPVSYEIMVSNLGPSDAANTTVTDLAQSTIANFAWTCVADTGVTCQSSGTGDLVDLIYLPVNKSVVYYITGDVPSSATGDLINTATVFVAAPVDEDELDNNVSSTDDPIQVVSDVQLTIYDSLDPYDPDSLDSLQLYVNVINYGPSDARDVLTVTNVPNVAEQIQFENNSSDCDLIIYGLFCETSVLQPGEQENTVVNMRLIANTPSSVNTNAEVTSSTFDPNLSNNEVVENTRLETGIDITISKSDEMEESEPGAWLEYTIILENKGSVDAGDVIVDEQLPASLINANWSCEAFDGAACINVDENLITGGANMPAGSLVVFTLVAQIDPILADMSETHVTNTVEAVLVNGTDYNTSNNVASDSNLLIYFIFKNGFEELL